MLWGFGPMTFIRNPPAVWQRARHMRSWCHQHRSPSLLAQARHLFACDLNNSIGKTPKQEVAADTLAESLVPDGSAVLNPCLTTDPYV